jgi:uncharacterized protein
MPNAVLDSTTLVSAFLTPQGVSRQLLNQAVAGAFDVFLSEAILEETREVLLTRAHLRARFVYTDQEVEEFCALLRAFARMVSDPPALKASRDPNDDMVLACALAAGVAYLVTRDKDLLTLKTYQGVEMVRPEEFMGLLREAARKR